MTIAQDTLQSEKSYNLEEIVITSDKLDTKLVDVSTKVEILNRKQIEKINGNRISEILKTSSNIFVKSYGLSSALNTISINGLGAEHTLIIIDGIRLNSFQNSHIDLSLVPKDNIEQIEVINNGISSIYGSDAMGGVVNIKLKKRERLEGDRTSKYNASVSAGSFNTQAYSFGYYQEIEKFNTRVSFSREVSDGDYEYYFNETNEKLLKNRDNAAYDIYDIGLSTQYLINNNNIVKFISTYSDQDKEVPGIETGVTPPLTKQLDRNWNNILSVENKLASNIFLKTNFNFQNNLMKYSVGQILNSTYKNVVYSGGSEIRIKNEFYGVTSGYNFVHAELESNDLKEGIKRNQHSIFTTVFYGPFNWLKVFPSARYDYISDISKGTYTYKMGINLQPFNKNDFSIRSNVGKNFRAPSFNDLYWKNGGNENLRPENSINFEGGLFYRFTNFLKWQVEFSYTYISAENKIVWTPQTSGFWTPRNIAESISNNFSLTLKTEKDLAADISLSLGGGLNLVNIRKTSSAYPGDPTQDKFLPYIPRQSAKLNFGIIYKSVEMNLFYSFNGNRYSDFSNTVKMKEFNTVDGNISYGFLFYKIYSKIRFEVNNVFNTEYEVISGYPMPLRYFRINLSFNY